MTSANRTARPPGATQGNPGTCPPDLAQALTAGADAAKQQMETVLKEGNLTPVINGWMLTFHGYEAAYLVANPIGRYSIGDRTPGLRRDALTIVIQHCQPADPATGCPPQPRRSGRSCACTSQSLPYWTACIRSRSSPSWRPRPAADSRPESAGAAGPSAISGQVRLSRITARCSSASGARAACPSRWLPGWLPGWLRIPVHPIVAVSG
jgi:hypothetical protein